MIKYGSPIGYATEDIPAGSWIHTHNMKTGLGDLLEYSYQKEFTSLEPQEERFFEGYRRTDGKAGVRNEIWIIPTVGCVNSIATSVAAMCKRISAGQRRCDRRIPTSLWMFSNGR